MRPTLIHVFTGLLLGVALAGLLNVPGQVVAHQESIPPVRPPQVVKPKQEPVVRVAPALERTPVTKKAPPARPRVVVKRVVVRIPRPQPAPASPVDATWVAEDFGGRERSRFTLVLGSGGRTAVC